MEKVRSPTYEENYVNLARAVVLKIIIDGLSGNYDLKHYILYDDDFLFWLYTANWAQYEEIIKDKFCQFKGIDRSLQKKLNTYYRLKGEKMKARKKYESYTDSRNTE